MLKNATIRQKFIAIYVDMIVFTLPILYISYLAMRWINNAQDFEAGQKIVSTFAWGYPVFILVYVIVTYSIGRTLTKMIAFPLRDLAGKAKEIATGNIDVTLDFDSKDEVGMLVKEFRVLVNAFQKQADVLIAISKGDYTGQIEVRSSGDAVN